MACVASVEVRRIMVTEEHEDRDSVELTDPGHEAKRTNFPPTNRADPRLVTRRSTQAPLLCGGVVSTGAW
jgi:hypothetical protein